MQNELENAGITWKRKRQLRISTLAQSFAVAAGFLKVLW